MSEFDDVGIIFSMCGSRIECSIHLDLKNCFHRCERVIPTKIERRIEISSIYEIRLARCRLYE